MKLMKTPWRFLADLVSRKQSLHKPDSAGENSSIIALEYHPVQDEAAEHHWSDRADDEREIPDPDPVAEDLVTALADQGALIPDLAETASSSPIDGLRSSVAFVGEIVALDTAHRQADEEAVTRKQPSDDKPRSEVSQLKKVAGAPKRANNSSPLALEDPFLAVRTITDEMSDLDAEIQILRRQLAEKLLLQNSYLKRLLERYTEN
jgi:hypothetical protein